jgi:hypothetical protein
MMAVQTFEFGETYTAKVFKFHNEIDVLNKRSIYDGVTKLETSLNAKDM